MPIKFATLCCIGVLLMSTLCFWRGNVMSDERQYVIRIPNFHTQPSGNVSQAVDQAVKSHREMIADVMGQLRQDTLSDEGKVHAFYLLGQLRATEAVSILIENIDLKAPRVDSKTGIGRWGMYPAQEALSKIGNPAVQMILDLLPTEGNELRRQLMCMVITDVEGNNFGRTLLKFRLDQESDPSRKANLELALRFLSGA